LSLSDNREIFKMTSLGSNLPGEMRAAVREHWKTFLIKGILLVVLGLGAMFVPPLANLAINVFLGWLFLISGIAGLC
jgi:uncharacterized membrane protein HdeD (DUF308 family)